MSTERTIRNRFKLKGNRWIETEELFRDQYEGSLLYFSYPTFLWAWNFQCFTARRNRLCKYRRAGNTVPYRGVFVQCATAGVA